MVQHKEIELLGFARDARRDVVTVMGTSADWKVLFGEPEKDVDDARRLLHAFSRNEAEALARVFAEESPQAFLVEIARVAQLPPTGACVESFAAFNAGRLRPAQQIEVALHAVACVACGASLAKSLADGQARQRRELEQLGMRLTQRSFANLLTDVRARVSALYRWHVTTALAETAIAALVITCLLPSEAPKGRLLLSAIPTLFVYLGVTRAFVVHSLIPALADRCFVLRPTVPARKFDLVRSWRAASSLISLGGILSYTLWGAVTGLITGFEVLLLLSVVAGVGMNFLSWRRLRRIDLRPFLEPSLTDPQTTMAQLSSEAARSRQPLRDQYMHLVGAFALAVAIAAVESAPLVSVVATAILVVAAGFAVPSQQHRYC